MNKLRSESQKADRRIRAVRALVVAVTAAVSVVTDAGGQITLDGTVGPKGALQGPDYTIGADLGTQRGGNLFHSFGDFNIHSGESATFTGPRSIDNIIGRVTGGNASSIDGRLASDIPGADLYLINPAGVMFGPDATLDVKGSFNVSTADYLRLAGGGRFDARQPDSSVLTAAAPQAFGFLGKPAAIDFYFSKLSVPDGETLRIVGGDEHARFASFAAPAGRIDLMSVASEGEMTPGATVGADAASITNARLGEVSLTDFTTLDTSGEGGGAIVIRAGHFELDSSTITAETKGASDGIGIDIRVDTASLRNEADVMAATSGPGKGGSLTVIADESITLSNTNHFSQGAGLTSRALEGFGGEQVGRGGDVFISAPSVRLANGAVIASTLGNGAAGDVELRAQRLTISDGGLVAGSTDGSGAGGAVSVSAADSIVVAGDMDAGDSGIYANAFDEMPDAGNAGSIRVTTPKLTLSGGGAIDGTSFGPGNAASVEINVPGKLDISGEDRRGLGSRIAANAQGEMRDAGDGGSVAILAGSVDLTAGGTIDTASFGAGKGGSITLDASRSIHVAGANSQGKQSGIYAGAQGEGDLAGDGGPIRLSTVALLLSDGGMISSSSFGAGHGGEIEVNASGSVAIIGGNTISGIIDNASGTGHAGSVRVSAPTLELAAGGTITSNAFAVGNAGSIVVAAQSIDISGEDETADDSGIFSNSVGDVDAAGSAGSITISTVELALSRGGRISSTTNGPGAGGAIVVQAAERIEISGEDAEGFNSGINARTVGDLGGDAGSIQLSTKRLSLAAGAAVSSTTTGAGRGGAIDVNADTIEVSGNDREGFVSQITANTQGEFIEAGAAGSIAVTATSLTLSAGGVIGSSSFGPGAAGSVEVDASRSIAISGLSTKGDRSGLFVAADAEGPFAGDAGTITASAPMIRLSGGGTIGASTRGEGNGGRIVVSARDGIDITGRGSSISSRATGESDEAGDAGEITVTAAGIALSDSAALTTESTGAGRAGDLTVNAERIEIADHASISSRGASVTEPGGNVILRANRLFHADDASVTAEAAIARGGNVEISARDIRLERGSTVTASVGGGEGNGGNVTLNAQTIVAAGDSDITARAVGGRGGNITATATAFLRCPECEVDASSQLSEQGTVQINSPDTNLAGLLARLPESFLRADEVLPRGCARGEESTFVIRGADSVPPSPDLAE